MTMMVFDVPTFYTGVGDHVVEHIPPRKLTEATEIATILETWKLILRGGGAIGFDTAFECGIKDPANKVIYLSRKEQKYPDDLWVKAVQLVLETHPYPPAAHRFMNLLARNAFQVLGDDLRTPSKFVVCWTSNGKDIGGTGTTIRIAKKYSIPVVNMYNRAISDVLGEIRRIIVS
jgi:hypothetical protein